MPLSKNGAPLRKVKYYAEFIKWEIVRNIKTGEIQYLCWRKVILDYEVEFDENGNETIPPEKNKSRFENGEGEAGKGTWPNSKIPVLVPPLANDVVRKIVPRKDP